jgi:hypothetical protein
MIVSPVMVDMFSSVIVGMFDFVERDDVVGEYPVVMFESLGPGSVVVVITVVKLMHIND